jgi:D-alanine-D-alanine ligase
VSSRGRLLVLWNQTEEDIYEKYRAEGPRPLHFDPTREASDVGTVAEEMEAFVGGLEAARFAVEVVNVKDDLDTLIGAIRRARPDAIFNLVEYFKDDQQQEAYVAGLYELMGVAYTGNRPITLATCQNKYRTKLLCEAAGLPTAQFFLATRAPVPRDHGLAFPLIVKPAFEDASGGIDADSVVVDQRALEEQVARVLGEFEMPALVEEYIEGREIHAAILGNHPPEVLPLFEMEFEPAEEDEAWKPQIITYRAKWDPHSSDFYSMDAVVPPLDLDPAVAGAIRSIAVDAFVAVRGRDYARVDMRVSADGQPFILEINPNPDLVDGAAFAMCAEASGRSYGETLGAIADLAVARGRRIRPRRGGGPSDQLLREHLAARPTES